jgi:hypothetical protein
VNAERLNFAATPETWGFRHDSTTDQSKQPTVMAEACAEVNLGCPRRAENEQVDKHSLPATAEYISCSILLFLSLLYPQNNSSYTSFNYTH